MPWLSRRPWGGGGHAWRTQAPQSRRVGTAVASGGQRRWASTWVGPPDGARLTGPLPWSPPLARCRGKWSPAAAHGRAPRSGYLPPGECGKSREVRRGRAPAYEAQRQAEVAWGQRCSTQLECPEAQLARADAADLATLAPMFSTPRSRNDRIAMTAQVAHWYSGQSANGRKLRHEIVCVKEGEGGGRKAFWILLDTRTAGVERLCPCAEFLT